MSKITKKGVMAILIAVLVTTFSFMFVTTFADSNYCHTHNWEEIKEGRYLCKACGEYCETVTATLEHIIAAHNGEASYTTTSIVTGYMCSGCGLTNDTPEPAGTDHDWQEEKIEPTCTEDGSIVYTCAYCGDSYTETLDATGHTEADAVVENNVDPTCTEDGSYDNVVYCSVCNEKLSSTTVTVPATGHGDLEEIDRKSPSCTEDGYVTYKCEICGETFTENLDATGHTEADAVVENNVDPTCTETGSYDSVVYCSVCNEKLSSTTITVPATGHDFIWAVDQEATETEEGAQHQECRICGEIGDSEVIPAIGEETAETTEEDSETDTTDSDDATETKETVDANDATDTSDDDAEDTTTDSADATDDTTDDSTASTSNDVPATGDESNAIPYAITLILSVVLLSAIIIYTKKRKA